MGAQSLTVTTSNVDPDTSGAWMKLDLTPDDQAFSVHFTGNGAAGTATIVAMLRKSDSTSERAYTATATVGAIRTGADGASGEYHCTVVFANSGNEWVDAAGFVKPSTRLPGLSVSPDGKEWFVGVTAFGTITGGTLTVVPVTDCD